MFILIDMIILINLPRRRFSYGSWKSQLLVLAVPRVLAAMALGLLAMLIGWGWGIFLLLFAQLAGTAALIWGAIIEPFRVGLTQLTVYSDRLPADAPPIRLLHITDLHIERLTHREDQVLQIVKKSQPDLILITGDYVNLSYNKDSTTHAHVRQLLSQLQAPYGVYATMGSITVDLRDQVVPIIEQLPIHLMRQAYQTVDLGNDRKVVLMGMDCTHFLPLDRERLAQLAAAAPNEAPQVLLYHSPELMPEASAVGVDLYLCGHTHGGQVRLPFIGALLTSSQLGRQYVMGLYRNGRTHLYISRGLGLEGLSAPRVRFLAPPEMVLVTLKGGNNEQSSVNGG